MQNRLEIMQVNTFDAGGGAEKIAFELLREYRRLGHGSRLVVRRRRTADPDVHAIPHERGGTPWSRFWWRLHRRVQPWYGRFAGSGALARLTHGLAAPAGWLDWLRGTEDFNYPGAWELLSALPPRPDVLHCHNLHGKYFDLRALPMLSRRVPLFLTLHDAWLLSGHCAHSFDCERWRSGCGRCPDLNIFPAVRRDDTAGNWRRKRDLLSRSRLFVATPSRWLMQRVESSLLWPGVVDARVIPNGVDLGVFQPGDAAAARADLDLPQDSAIVLFAANGIRANPWKDFETLRAAIAILARRPIGRPVLMLALGEAGAPMPRTAAHVRFAPFEHDPARVARYYQAADLYVHAARADTFPTTILEAQACGRAVVATAVGGIPEQVRDAGGPFRDGDRSPPGHGGDPTGLLVPPHDPVALAVGLERVLADDRLRRRMEAAAARHARDRFGLPAQARAYLDWYADVLNGPAQQSTGPRPVTASSPAP